MFGSITIANGGTLRIDNGGTVTVKVSLEGVIISNNGLITNAGTLNLDNTGKDIGIDNLATLTNTGTIYTKGGAGYGIANEGGTFTNNGIIDLHGPDGIHNIDLSASVFFDNYGSLTIEVFSMDSITTLAVSSTRNARGA